MDTIVSWGKARSKDWRTCVAYTYCTLVLFIILGAVSISSSKGFETPMTAVTPTVYQVIPDWN